MNTELAEQNQTDRAGGVWEYVSASRLNLWLRCGLAFRLRYIDRVPEPTTASLFVGKQVHQGLERLYRRRQVGLVDVLDVRLWRRSLPQVERRLSGEQRV